MKNIHDSNDPFDFSIVLGGPFFQLLLRLGLTTPTLDLLKKRIICITLFAWLPLLLLSIYEGTAWSNVGIPFLFDMEDQARFLIALPLLISAELLVHQQLRPLVGQFIDRGIITEKMVPRFKQLMAFAMKVRNSMTIELILLLLAIAGGHYFWNAVSVKKTLTSYGTWYSPDNVSFSLAGYWYVFVSRPLFQFIAYRWYFRILIWAGFLWKTSTLNLNLQPTHPDRACGLGFLSMTSTMFAPLVIAHGVLFSGFMANSILYTGAHLTDYSILILCIIFFVLLLVLGPLFAFTVPLMRAKRTGIRDYGVLSSEYVNAFDIKWVRGNASKEEQLMGNSDIQSLADIGNSFQVVQQIRSFPFDKESIFQVIVFVLIPIMPLVLTIVPLDVIISKFFTALF